MSERATVTPPRMPAPAGVEIRPIALADVTEAYVGWLNDPEVVRYTEQSGRRHTRAKVEAFVQAKLQSDNEFLFAILSDARHVGNIKLGPVNRRHLSAEVSYLIGDRGSWGRGIATAAIGLIVTRAFAEYGVEKLTASTYAPNIASEKALLKNGFTLEGVRRGQVIFEGARVDVRMFGRLKAQ